VGLLAERALAAGFGSTCEESENKAPISGSRAERYQVVLYVEESTLSADAEPGMSELEDGTQVSAETARRLSCDASRVVVSRDEDGAIHNVGRRTRTVPPATRRALEARDRGCRFPGCGLRFTDAHHVEHWADGGETALRNLVLLCRRHHRRVHEDGWKICSDKNGQVVVFTPTGKALGQVPKAGEVPMAGQQLRSAEALIASEVASAASVAFGAAVSPADAGGRSTGAGGSATWAAQRWRHDRDVPWSVEAAAWEALDPRDEDDDEAA
jgi:hypothetical protein